MTPRFYKLDIYRGGGAEPSIYFTNPIYFYVRSGTNQISNNVRSGNDQISYNVHTPTLLKHALT